MPRLSDLIRTSLTPSQAGYLLERDHRGHHKSAWFLDAAATGVLEIRSDGPNVTVQRGAEDPRNSAREVLDALFEHGETVAVGDDRPDFRHAWELVDKQLEKWSLDTAVLKPRPFRRFMRWTRPHTELGSRLASDARALCTAIVAATPAQVAQAADEHRLAELTAWAVGMGIGNHWRDQLADAVSASDAALSVEDEQVHAVTLLLLLHVAANRSAVSRVQVDITGQRKSEGEIRPTAFVRLIRNHRTGF